MKILLKLASWLFHPLWMPLTGSILYFFLTPRFFPSEIIKAKLLAIAILTIFIPVVFYFLLKNLGKAESIFLTNVAERRWPLFFFMLLCVMVLSQILNVYNYPALYYYFVGILFSTLSCYILTWFRLKISLHMVGLAGLLLFIIALSINFHIYMLYTISFMIIIIGLTASSRLYFKAHTYPELLLGILIGLLPQIIVVNYWL